ncbi:MAG TPA: hypothetical protein VN781_05300 [Acidimicrobiales bacterium]|nr:hypothetical protein [Acidimicrobiales bacterium]
MHPKALVKSALRPVLGPLVRRLDHRARVAVAPELDEIRRQLDYAIPAILTRISSQAASERGYVRSFGDLNQRIEFVRRELLFELRYRHPSAEAAPAAQKRVVHPEKLAAMGDRVRVNLGAGHLAKPEYLNVDSRELDGIDVVADVSDLPFEGGSLYEVYSAHVLEHFALEELRKVLLPYWVSLLAPGGSFVAVVPDMEAMIAECAAGRMPFEDFREVAYGAQEYEGDFHFNGFSPESLTGLLVEAGLTAVRVREAGRRNGLCYELEIEGTRPAATPG